MHRAKPAFRQPNQRRGAHWRRSVDRHFYGPEALAEEPLDVRRPRAGFADPEYRALRSDQARQSADHGRPADQPAAAQEAIVLAAVDARQEFRAHVDLLSDLGRKMAVEDAAGRIPGVEEFDGDGVAGISAQALFDRRAAVLGVGAGSRRCHAFGSKQGILSVDESLLCMVKDPDLAVLYAHGDASRRLWAFGTRGV